MLILKQELLSFPDNPVLYLLLIKRFIPSKDQLQLLNSID